MSEISLYYADWCGHCKTFKPEWEALKTTLDDMGVSHKEYESDANPKEVEAKGIKGFPTILIKKDKKEYVYTGPREAPSILYEMGVLDDLQLGGRRKNANKGESPYKGKYEKYKAKYMSLKKWMDKMGYMD